MMVNPKIELPKGGVTLNYAFWNRCNGANLSVKIFANLDYFVYCIKKKKTIFILEGNTFFYLILTFEFFSI